MVVQADLGAYDIRILFSLHVIISVKGIEFTYRGCTCVKIILPLLKNGIFRWSKFFPIFVEIALTSMECV